MMTHRFRKRNNKLMSLWEIGLSHIFRGFEVFLKVPVLIFIGFGKNNVLGTIHIDIYQFWSGRKGGTGFTLHFVIYYS